MTANANSTSLARRLPWHVIQPVSVALALVLLAFRLNTVAEGDWERLRISAVHQFWLVVPLALLSIRIRARSALQLVATGLFGFYTATFLADWLGEFAAELLGPSNPDVITIAVPLIEESLKVVPLLLVAWSWWKSRGSPGIVDFALSGLVCGAAFGFHEDALWGRLSSSGIDGAIGWTLPSMQSDISLVAGHAVWTGLVGIAIGFAVTRRRAWARMVAVGAMAVVTFDHGSWNNDVMRSDWRWLVADGWLPVVLFLLGLVVALIMDARAIRMAPAEARIEMRKVARYVTEGEDVAPIRRLLRGSRLLRLAAALAHGSVRRDVITSEVSA